MAAANAWGNKIYSATYSSVPVYEFKVGADNVMRRRADDWINATHILKVAGLDKPARTRILEREVQKGVHEKVQGGYGKYQGTWVPLQEGRELAQRNGVLEKLLPIFDFVAGDRSPPPAPKHTTAASSRPRVQKNVAPNRRLVSEESSFSPRKQQQVVQPPMPPASFSQDPHFSAANQSFRDDESVAQASMESSSMIAEEDMAPMSQHSMQSRKRKRGLNEVSLSIIEQQHIIYGDQLLDYFMTVGDAPAATRILPPEPPANFQVDRPIDDHGNTALHWACSMGDIDIVRDLINRGANVKALSNHDETPLVRAVLFTNNYEKGTMQDLADLLQETITFRDWFGATVFNHLAATTRSKGKWKSSRYYCQILMDKLNDILPPHQISLLLSSQDSNGDTAALAAAKNGCYRLATMLLSQCPEAGDILNKAGESANAILQTISRRHKDNPPAPSSVTHHSVTDTDHAELNNTSDNTAVCRPSTSSEATVSLLSKIGSIVDEASRKLALAYGDIKWPPQGEEDIGTPQGLYEHVESDRENIRKQVASLTAKENETDDLEAKLERFNKVKRDYESLIEQVQRLHLLKRLQNTKIDPESRAAQTNSSGESSGSSSNNTTTSNSNNKSPEDLNLLYQVTSQLFEAQQARQKAIKELIQQKADAGVSTKLDVHRKLISLATGLPEEELDPMASELANALEFDRANEKRPDDRDLGLDGALDGDEHQHLEYQQEKKQQQQQQQALATRRDSMGMPLSMSMSERAVPG
ncbi:transcription factor MBP1 [Blastomyces silverae]|uniref:Cell pattern formation-associated protein stuA n=1 Tax=Blastomyces silverae TaxID=2060906 RepID=A0A0H1BQ95_9EURO|nr:transcription factor MBP1 [Blastomyces silverae]